MVSNSCWVLKLFLIVFIYFIIRGVKSQVFVLLHASI